MENELEVIAHAQQDPEAFGRLYDTYYQPVFGFMYNRTGNAEVAKDLTSETFFQALKNLHKYKPQKGKQFKSWLFAIGVAQVGNYFRSRAKMFTVSTDEAPELVGRDEFQPDIAYRMGEDAEELQDQVNLLRRMFKQLNQKQQNILTLRYFSHMTIPEISAVMKMKEGTIKSHIHRAIKKLQVLMVDDQDLTEESSIPDQPICSATQSCYEAQASNN
jgi:RNA polymerase sigma-70 factor, ECF subfamily